MREPLRAALRDAGGALAELSDELAARPHEEPWPPHIAASGPRAAGRESEYKLLLELIVEGARLHYDPPLPALREDPDLALLLGDQLYALGLVRLAALGDVEAVQELADVISLVAHAHAARQPALAAAVWQAGAIAIGWGPSPQHENAKSLARAGDPGAVEALLEAATRRS